MFNLPINPNDNHKHDCHDHDHDHNPNPSPSWRELGLRPFDRISVTSTFGTGQGLFLRAEGNVLVWITDMFGPVAVTRSILENAHITKLS
ncbi:hypothetical protein CD33_08000 [Ureibacillus sinduriensis BLB-1 = JCM 15800]|uniref:Uncharacterized protein n=1 Tax=Ureibacillus sinduriensis BLB-1 = JCM 15800 TaxID=1384057 RepID=A0A0A3HXZ5_9BACL|nr:hypothetical protein CD33_08000 [Ureibacillus sinduriensis BLB-1 = JCM 15800]